MAKKLQLLAGRTVEDKTQSFMTKIDFLKIYKSYFYKMAYSGITKNWITQLINYLDDIALDQILSNGAKETITTPTMSDCESEANSEKPVEPPEIKNKEEKKSEPEDTENDKSLEIIEPKKDEIDEKEENKENLETTLNVSDSQTEPMSVSDSKIEPVSVSESEKENTDSKIEDSDSKDNSEPQTEKLNSSDIVEVTG